MKLPLYRFLFILSLLSAAITSPAQPAQVMEQAGQAYNDEDYDRAIELYEQLLSEGYTSAALHYNLGNAYYRQHQLAPAILHYERARLSAPGDEDIQHNLAVARAKQVDQREPLPDFFLSAGWKNMRARLTTTGWTLLGLIVLWWSAAGFILWLWGSTRLWRKRGFLAAILLLIFSILPFALAISRAQYDQYSGEAILMTPDSGLHAAPDADSQVIATVHEGLKLEIMDQIGEWYKVRLPDGEIGWMPVQVMEVI